MLGPPSVLALARAAGLTTASVNNWRQMDSLIEPGASTYRLFIDGGYDPDEDDQMVDLLIAARRTSVADLTFVYLCRPDLAGHDHGWDTPEYLVSLHRVDHTLGRLLDALGPDSDVVVTTDHGGDGRNHGVVNDAVMQVFVAARSHRIAPGSFWEAASTLDVAPTVADLVGLDPHPEWEGTSLIGSERPVVDHLIDLLAASDRFTYGEDLSMLAHALQSAAQLEAAGGDDELVLAALLHDIGHLLGPEGPYGYPAHAAAGAQHLQPWLPATVVEPIRLHVAAKQHLVGSTPDYAGRLSAASRITLDQQGGPFDEAESAAFLAEPHAERAVRLRTCDDLGKHPDVGTPTLESFRPRLAAALATPPVDPTWARDACRCATCRDHNSDQHLLDVWDLSGWTVLGSRRSPGRLEVDLARGTDRHTAIIPDALRDADAATKHARPRTFGSDCLPQRRRSSDLDQIAVDVTHTGLAYMAGIDAVDGEVLRFARSLGYVRETNYGALFDVRTEPRPTNLASTPIALPLHTDNPYRDPCPTVQVLHCLRPAAHGGMTRLADGFVAAERLRLEAPAAFELLASRLVTFRYHDDDVDLRARRTVIDVDSDGAIRGVALNHRSLDTAADSAYAAALSAFVERLDEAAIELLLAQGEAIVFDNRRVLHARTGFDPSSGRHLQGCYIDIDALHSRARRAALTRPDDQP